MNERAKRLSHKSFSVEFTAKLMPTSENENEIKPTDDYYHMQMYQKKGRRKRK